MFTKKYIWFLLSDYKITFCSFNFRHIKFKFVTILKTYKLGCQKQCKLCKFEMLTFLGKNFLFFWIFLFSDSHILLKVTLFEFPSRNPQSIAVVGVDCKTKKAQIIYIFRNPFLKNNLSIFTKNGKWSVPMSFLNIFGHLNALLILMKKIKKSKLR